MSSTAKPSRRAAVASRSSAVTMCSDAGKPSATTTAAASCSASAARRAWTRRRRRAAPRTAAVACTSFHASASETKRSRAVAVAASVSAPSRSSLDSADTHSISVAHQDAHHRVLQGDRLQRLGGLLGNGQRDDRRAVPEPQRPSRLSSSRAATALAPCSGTGGLVDTNSIAGGLRADRTAPDRSSRAIRPSASGAALTADSNRATGVPRSMIRIDSPART